MLLSICIPTYNGSKYIRKNLDIMIRQIQENNLSDDIEIVVSDNCSTDSIPQIMEEYVNKYPNFIRYSRNDKNLGYDGNIIKLTKLAEGKFIHLFGDDDYFAPNGLIRLYKVLKERPDLSILVLSNYYHKNDNYDEVISRRGLQKIFSNKDRVYINDSDNFIIDVEDRAWPNTNVVFRKEYFDKIPNIQQFYKTDWIHIYIYIYVAKNWQNCYLFSDKHPIIIDRVGVQTWLNNDDGPRIYYHNLWTYSFANTLGYSKKVFNWYRKKLLKEYIKNITYRRSQSFKINFSYLLKYFPYWWDCWNFYLLFIPKFLDLKNEILSIRNYDSNKKKKAKTKILKICFMEYKLAVKRNKKLKPLFMHNMLADEFIEVCNEQGNFKQFVKSSVYKEMQDYILKNEYLFTGKSKKIKNRILRMKNKKLIPYSCYLDDCLEMTNLIHKKGILKK